MEHPDCGHLSSQLMSHLTHLYFSLTSPLPRQHRFQHDSLPCCSSNDNISGLVLFRNERNENGKRARINGGLPRNVKKRNVLNAERANLQECMSVRVTEETRMDVLLTVEYHNHCMTKDANEEELLDRDRMPAHVYLLYEARQSFCIGKRTQFRFSFGPPAGTNGSESWKWESYYGGEFSIIYRVKLIVHEKESFMGRIWKGLRSVVGAGEAVTLRDDTDKDPLRWQPSLSGITDSHHTTQHTLSPNSRMLTEQILVLHLQPSLRAKGPPLIMKLQSPPSKLLSLSHIDGSLSLMVNIQGSIYHTKDVIAGSLIFYKQRLGQITNVTLCLLRREEQRERSIPISQLSAKEGYGSMLNGSAAEDLSALHSIASRGIAGVPTQLKKNRKINPLPNHPIKLLMRFEILDGTPGINEEINFRVPLGACEELTPTFVHVEDVSEQQETSGGTPLVRWLLSSVKYYLVVMINSQNNHRYFCEREIELYRYNSKADESRQETQIEHTQEAYDACVK